MNGCLILPTTDQKPTGKPAPVWGFLNHPVVKQQQSVSHLWWDFHWKTWEPSQRSAQHFIPSLLTNLAELCLPKAPAENLFIDNTRGKKTFPIIFHASHRVLLVSPRAPLSLQYLLLLDLGLY